MESDLSKIRREYTKGKLTKCNSCDNPFEQFQQWLDEAILAGEEEPTAMVIATVSKEGFPSTRTVLLKGIEKGKFIFFTNYESRKGKQLADNPHISLTFVWHKLERQIHIEGKAEKTTPDESDTYFSSRPENSKIAARVSPQSQKIRSRMEIMRPFAKESIEYSGLEIKRPGNWGGYAILPTRFEFWQGRENRLHDRIEYTFRDKSNWKKVRLAP